MDPHLQHTFCQEFISYIYPAKNMNCIEVQSPVCVPLSNELSKDLINPS